MFNKCGKYCLKLLCISSKSIIHSYRECRCHVWAGSPSCSVELLQKWVCRTVGPSLASSLEPLVLCWNTASLSLFYRYYFSRCSSELTQLVPCPYSRGKSTCYFDRVHDFSITIRRCYKDVNVNSFFPPSARLKNPLPIDCRFCLNRFRVCCNFFVLLFLVTPYPVVAVQPCMEWILI